MAASKVWEEFWKQFNEITVDISNSDQFMLFRGESRDYGDSRLQSGLARATALRSNSHAINLEAESHMMKSFKRSAGAFLSQSKLPRNEIEWLILAQHYGVPTRLLDWTTNPLVSLYFASLKTDTNLSFFSPDDKDGYIFILKDISVFDDFEKLDFYEGGYDRKYVESVTDFYAKPLKDFRFYENALFIRPEYVDQRYRNQSTILMYEVRPGDRFLHLPDKVRVLKVPAKIKHQVRVYLRQLGISNDFIYPSLEGAARKAVLDVIDSATPT